MMAAPGVLSAVRRGSPRTLPLRRGLYCLERRQRSRQSCLLIGGQVGELDAALVVVPLLTFQGLLGAAEPGPRDTPGEPERPEGRRKVQIADHPVVEQRLVPDARAEGTEVEDVHAMMRESPVAEMLCDRESGNTSRVWPSRHTPSSLRELDIPRYRPQDRRSV